VRAIVRIGPAAKDALPKLQALSKDGFPSIRSADGRCDKKSVNAITTPSGEVYRPTRKTVGFDKETNRILSRTTSAILDG
jgi:hypothetical protein